MALSEENDQALRKILKKEGAESVVAFLASWCLEEWQRRLAATGNNKEEIRKTADKYNNAAFYLDKAKNKLKLWQGKREEVEEDEPAAAGSA